MKARKIRMLAPVFAMLAAGSALAEETNAVTQVASAVTSTVNDVAAQVVAVVLVGLAIWGTFFVVRMIKAAAKTGASR